MTDEETLKNKVRETHIRFREACGRSLSESQMCVLYAEDVKETADKGTQVKKKASESDSMIHAIEGLAYGNS